MNKYTMKFDANDEVVKYIFVPPPPNKWTLSIGSETLLFFLPDAPNRFHRFMQKLVFGLHWKKIEETVK